MTVLRGILVVLLLAVAGCAGLTIDGSSSFPKVEARDGGDGVVIVEHVGGACVPLGDFSFHVKHEGGTVASSPDGASQWCEGDTVEVQGVPGERQTLQVIHDPTNAVVYEKTFTLA